MAAKILNEIKIQVVLKAVKKAKLTKNARWILTTKDLSQETVLSQFGVLMMSTLNREKDSRSCSNHFWSVWYFCDTLYVQAVKNAVLPILSLHHMECVVTKT